MTNLTMIIVSTAIVTIIIIIEIIGRSQTHQQCAVVMPRCAFPPCPARVGHPSNSSASPCGADSEAGRDGVTREGVCLYCNQSLSDIFVDLRRRRHDGYGMNTHTHTTHSHHTSKTPAPNTLCLHRANLGAGSGSCQWFPPTGSRTVPACCSRRLVLPVRDGTWP